MQILRERLSQNTFALLISNGGSAVLAFLLSVLIGRVLGEDGLGVYASALAWIFPLSLACEFGLGTLIVRDVAQIPDAGDAYLRTSILARLTIGSALVIFVWLIAPALSNNPLVVQGIRLSTPLIIILPFYSSFTAIFRAQQVMMPIAWLNLGMLISQVFLTLIVFIANGNILHVLAVNTLTSSGQLVAAWIIYKKQFYRPSQNVIDLIPLLKSAMPFAIAAVLAAIQTRINIILLERYTSTSEVGYYAAAIRFVEAGRMLPHAFFDALFPMLAGLAIIPHKLNTMFRRVIFALVVFGVLFGIAISFYSRTILMFTYGTAFTPAIPILKIAAWSLLPMLLKGGHTLYWYAKGQESFVNIVTAIVIVIQVILAIRVIPHYGAMGAAVVSIFAETIAFILLFLRRD